MKLNVQYKIKIVNISKGVERLSLQGQKVTFWRSASKYKKYPTISKNVVVMLDPCQSIAKRKRFRDQ